MNRYYLGLGSNLGDRHAALREAMERMERMGIRVERCSVLRVTDPWGFKSEHSFVNGVCRVACDMEPMELLERTQEVERAMGRTTKSDTGEGGYADRVIDIDLLCGLGPDGALMRVEEKRLRMPHPLIAQREFVWMPLREVMEPEEWLKVTEVMGE